MKDADQNPSNNRNICKIEHRPELHIDRIDDTVAPQPIEQIAAGSTDRHSQERSARSHFGVRPKDSTQIQHGCIAVDRQSIETEKDSTHALPRRILRKRFTI
jgi:hypothetical protein